MRPFHHILFPADLSNEAKPAFATALRIRLGSPGLLSVVHVSDEQELLTNWSQVPDRQMLQDWGVLAADAGPEGAEALGIEILFHRVPGHDPAADVVASAHDEHPNLVVVATRQPEGLVRLIDGSIADDISQRSGLLALVVPKAGHSLVEPSSGAVTLSRIVLPIAEDFPQQACFEALFQLAHHLGVARCHLTLVHVGTGSPPLPRIDLWSWPGLTWDLARREGIIADQILAVAADTHAHLIVMATQGHDTLRDMLGGSVTQKVVRRAQCPVLVIPTQ